LPERNALAYWAHLLCEEKRFLYIFVQLAINEKFAEPIEKGHIRHTRSLKGSKGKLSWYQARPLSSTRDAPVQGINDIRAQCYKTFYGRNLQICDKLACLSRASLSSLLLMFVSKAGAYSSGAPFKHYSKSILQDLPANIRLG
jgi:hypothetical protein